MSKLYTNKLNVNRPISKLILFSVLIFSSFNSYSQLIVPFTPRTSSVTPARTVYTVKGDFSMVGNTNLTSAVYSDTSANNNAMIYVDVDADNDTWNSSSSTLILPTENGSIPGCSNIIYAGLYWTGSAVGSGVEQYEFTTNIDGVPTTIDKRNIKFKPPNATDYIDVTANDDDIYFPAPGVFSNIYSAYAEVTDLIDPADFLGEYFVADLPSAEGILPPAGYHGGWGMVVVYENSLMDWRDITVFDGHAHVSGEIADYTFDVNGFNTAQSGDVAVKLGIMAAEGDVNLSGDYFEILRQDNNTFQRLSHSTNTTNNFFNSSINVGNDGPRNPNLNNNTGLDIAMFNIDNTGNGIITNNQTSTTFRYGTTSDRFVIYNVTFSVNSYVPEVTGVITNTSINGIPNPTPITIEPGQAALYELEIKNIGTEATNNTVVTIPLPDTVNPNNLNIIFNTFYSPLSPDYIDPQYDGSIGTNGAIVWNLGTLPLPIDIDDVLAEISFELTATTNCAILGDINNIPSITLFGSISGVGAVSNVPFDTPLIQGFATDDICRDNPIPIPIIIPIDYLAFINEGPTITCPTDIIQSADTGESGAIVTYTEPVGTDNAPGAITTRIAGPGPGDLFPIGTTTVTYQVIDDCGIIATCSFTVTVTDDQDPTITCPPSVNITVDAGQNGAIVTYTAPVISDNSPGATIAQTAGLASGSLFPEGVTTNTFVVTDASGNTATCSFTVTVTDDEDPTITCPPSVNITADAGQNGAIVTYTAPVISDNAPGATIAQTAGLASGSLFPVGTTTNTFVVTDASGNAATCSFTVTVTDDEDPSITCPPVVNITADAGQNGAIVTYTAPVISDNSPGATIAQTAGLASGSLFPVGVTTNTFVVTDASGNTATCSFTVTVTDDEDPTITCPPLVNINVDAGQNGAIVTYTAPVISDNSPGATIAQTAGLPSGSLFPVGVTINTFVVTDASGNTATCSFTVTVTDDEDPTITCPPLVNITADAGQNGAIVTYADPVISDNAPGATIAQTAGLASGSLFPVGTTTNTFVVTDASGNAATCSFTVTVTDDEDPSITCPPVVNITADAGQNGAIVTYTAPVISDNSPGATIAQTAGLPSGSLFPVGVTTNTFVVTDASGNTATCSFTVTVTDDEDPTITCPPSVNITADAGQNGAIVTYTAPVISDNAPGATFAQTAGLPSGSLFPVGVTTNTFVVTDASGNTATCSFTVTVTDDEDPTITCPPSVNITADAGQNGAIVTYTAPVISDNAPGATFALTAGLPSGSLFPVGVTTNTFVVTDASGNTATCSFTVTVTDDEDPSITCPPVVNITADAGQNGAIVTYTAPVISDNSPGATIAQTAGLASGSLFPVGTTTNTFVVTDASGNTATCSFTVTVTDDEDPTITCPPSVNITADAGQNGAIVTYADPVISDNAPGATFALTAGLPSGSLFPVGVTTNTFVVTDASGNTATCSFTVTVTDDEDPTITCPPSVNITADAGQNGAIVTYTAPVISDNSPGATIAQTAGLASGSLFPVGTTTNTFVVTDSNGNTATCSFTVTVTDDENPSITCPGDINQNVDIGLCGAVIIYTNPVGTDNAPGAVTIQTAGLPSGSEFPVGITTNTFEVTDANGNTATCSFTVTVIDNEPPVIVCPADISQTTDSNQCVSTITIVDPTATDNCSTIFVFEGIRSDNLALSDPYPVGSTTITWTATDEANNTSLGCIQTINITDDEAPAFVETLPVDVVVECDQVPVAAILTATDNCNTANVTFNEVRTDGSCVSDYILERTWIATDDNGNTTTYVQIITVEDNTPPVLSLPANVTAECSDDLSPIAFGRATATDNCDASPVISFSDATMSGACSGTFTITRTWTATDACGNISTADQIISTSDTTAPEFVEDLPQNLTIECNSVPTAETITATDNCGTAEVTVNDTRTDGNCPNNYIITRIYTATDECGLTNTHIQTITVVDITPPVFVEALPTANLVVECDSVPTPETLTATDTCGSASVSVADVITNGNCDNNYTIARTWTATDECGLTTTHTQIIVVQDTTPPVFVEALPADILVECDAIPTAENITATDNCGDATVAVTDVRTDGDCPSNYIISRTWTATDECGLTTEHTQNITVQDTTAPIPTSTFDQTLNVSCADVPDAPQLEFTDNCSTNVIVLFNETNSFDENVLVDYEIVRTWTVRDACNNEAVYTQTLFVTLDEVITDVTAPDRCFDDGIVNLNDFIGDLNTNGVWEIIEGDTAATVTGSIFDPSGLELSETFLPEDGGIDYKFRYTTTDAGCISITELIMNVNADCVVLPCGENDVVVSKAVTPNGDQFNEFFEVSGVELCGFQYEVKIFNRWGSLIYESDNYQNDWNGKAMRSIGAASNVPNGTYYYIVILKNSGLNPITGPVYLGTK